MTDMQKLSFAVAQIPLIQQILNNAAAFWVTPRVAIGQASAQLASLLMELQIPSTAATTATPPLHRGVLSMDPRTELAKMGIHEGVHAQATAAGIDLALLLSIAQAVVQYGPQVLKVVTPLLPANVATVIQAVLAILAPKPA